MNPKALRMGSGLGGQVGVVLCHQADERCLQGNTSHDSTGTQGRIDGGIRFMMQYLRVPGFWVVATFCSLRQWLVQLGC